MRLCYKAILALLVTLFVTALSSCRHKDLSLLENPGVRVFVVFDWANDPDANPSSMALYMYPAGGGTPLRYIFTGREGGEIRLPAGVYDAVCVNGDNTDWASLRQTEVKEGVLVASSAPDPLSPFYSLNELLTSRPESTDGNTFVAEPRATWVGAYDNFDARYDGRDKTLTIMPSDVICHYVVDIYDVDGLEDDSKETRGDVSVMASLSNMADGVLIYSASPSTNKRAIPFYLQKGETPSSLHGEFLTFGEDAPAANAHHLSLYTKMEDESWAVQTKEVTDQVHGAPDPRNVHIVIHGAKVPHAEGGSQGLIVDVNGWESEYFHMKM